MNNVFLYAGKSNNQVGLCDPTVVCPAPSLPNVSVWSYTQSIISAQVGINDSLVFFTVDKDCDQWEARADGNGNVGVGLLVGSGGPLSKAQVGSFDIVSSELTDGDKVYSIDIFAHNIAGWNSRE
jgi:hypothetical protein